MSASRPLVLNGGRSGELPAGRALKVGLATIDATGLTAERTHALPNASGTVALTSHTHVLSDIIGLQPIPTGSVIPFAGATAPVGWLLCFGQNVSRVTYASLFAVIGTQYGSGDGATTFGIPDLRGRAPFGKDDMGGSAANRITLGVSLIQGNTLGAAGGSEHAQSHTHQSNNGLGFVMRGTTLYQTAKTANGSDLTKGLGDSTNGAATAYAGAGSSENMPPTLILNFIIRT